MQILQKPIVESHFVGFNDTNPSELLTPGVFQVVQNAYVSDNKISKVPGSSSIAASIASQNIVGLSSYENISTSTKLIVACVNGVSNSRLYTWGGSGNFSAIGSANLTNSLPMRFEVANNILWGFNGAEEVDYDGTTVTHNRSNVPLGYFPAWFHNYLFVANTTNYPNRLFWSNLGDPTTFSGSNYVDINPGDSDSITGLGMLQDELYVFKKETIWGVTGWSGSSFSSTTIATQNTNARIMGYGCISPDSIIGTGNDLYFFSFLGNVPVIRSLKKTINGVTLGGGVISEDIAGTMGSINLNALTAIQGIFDGRYAMWSVPTGSSTTNNLIIVLDTWGIGTHKGVTTYPWTTMNGKNAGRFILSSISGKELPYFSDTAASGLVFKFDSSIHSDNGSPVVMDVKTRDFMIDPSRKNKWKYLYFKYLTGSAGSLQVNARIDQAASFGTQAIQSLQGNSPGLGPTGNFTLGVSVLGGQMTSKSRVTFAQLVGTMLGVEFKEATSSPCTIYEYSIYAIPKGLRND